MHISSWTHTARPVEQTEDRSGHFAHTLVAWPTGSGGTGHEAENTGKAYTKARSPQLPPLSFSLFSLSSYLRRKNSTYITSHIHISQITTTANMAHTKLHSKADFDKALETKGKYVLIHAYSGSILDKAEE